jgi:hypothetical protein
MYNKLKLSIGLGLIMILSLGCNDVQQNSLNDELMLNDLNSETYSDLSNEEGTDSQSVQGSVKTSLSFEQVGYYKGESKLRYFTFYVSSAEPLKENNLPHDFLDNLKEHGSKQMNTSGQITASFYYLTRDSTPDITTLSADKANDIAHNRKPIVAVWIMPNGQINVIEKPE